MFNKTNSNAITLKSKIFSEFPSPFPEPTSNLRCFEQEDEPQRLFVSEIIDCEKRGYLNAPKAPSQNTYGQATC